VLPTSVAPPRPAFLDSPLQLYIGGRHFRYYAGLDHQDHGLGTAGIWTSDTSRALRLAEELGAGTVWINSCGMFDVAVPFGGRKHSGSGRELGEEALEPYLTSKSVWVDLQSAAAQAGHAISR
jgi:Aldehyde dehydrogenase family